MMLNVLCSIVNLGGRKAFLQQYCVMQKNMALMHQIKEIICLILFSVSLFWTFFRVICLFCCHVAVNYSSLQVKNRITIDICLRTIFIQFFMNLDYTKMFSFGPMSMVMLPDGR